MMSDTATTSRAEAVRRHMEATGVDEDAAHAIYHDDAVLEFPQSGERFEGVAKFRAWREQYPGKVRLDVREVRGCGDIWVGECGISYDDGPWQPALAILEFRGDGVSRETIYVAEPFDAPEWRAQYRAAPLGVSGS
jgi:SnoaL-like protein